MASSSNKGCLIIVVLSLALGVVFAAVVVALGAGMAWHLKDVPTLTLGEFELRPDDLACASVDIEVGMEFSNDLFEPCGPEVVDAYLAGEHEGAILANRVERYLGRPFLRPVAKGELINYLDFSAHRDSEEWLYAEAHAHARLKGPQVARWLIETTVTSDELFQCLDWRDELRDAVEALDRTCARDSDCEVIEPECMYHCSASAAGIPVSLTGEMRRYMRQCCRVSCSQRATPRCVAGVCEVETN
jgi:hypothetical protein